jgi:hypothetical protein
MQQRNFMDDVGPDLWRKRMPLGSTKLNFQEKFLYIRVILRYVKMSITHTFIFDHQGHSEFTLHEVACGSFPE